MKVNFTQDNAIVVRLLQGIAKILKLLMINPKKTAEPMTACVVDTVFFEINVNLMEFLEKNEKLTWNTTACGANNPNR